MLTKIAKTLILVVTLTACSSVPLKFSINQQSQFDYMPDPITWNRNIFTCRAQPQCNAADLFNRF